MSWDAMERGLVEWAVMLSEAKAISLGNRSKNDQRLFAALRMTL
jgi:hypothetical protein